MNITVTTDGTPAGTEATIDGASVLVEQVSSSVRTSPDGRKVVNVVVWGR